MATATLLLLLDRTPEEADLTRAFSGFAPVSRPAPPGRAHGVAVTPPGLEHATISADVFARRWDEDPSTLERAVLHAYDWGGGGAAAAVARHHGYLQVTVECTGSTSLPGGVSRKTEALTLATDAIGLVAGISGAIAYFAPGGEVLLGIDRLEKSLLLSRASAIPPLDLWSNVRMFRANDGYMVMDTVGLSQLDRIDHEVFLPPGDLSMNDIAMWLRNLTALSIRGTVFDEGTRAQGPGGVIFQAKKDVLAINAPARPVFRWRI